MLSTQKNVSCVNFCAGPLTQVMYILYNANNKRDFLVRVDINMDII